ncbi:helix-turn-helix domain-containing protein, partial [Candidatus Micrarchaeota archaeon]|nr:helix-turn-helix domain-containing protein [Candidatus Micrarchaeota archaeon]
SMLSSFSPYVKSFKGRGIVEINADKLRDKRKELQLSLEKLAERVGLAKESLYRFEHGASTSLETAKKLEEVLKTDLILEKNLLEEFYKSQLQKKKELFGEKIRDEVLEKIHGMGLDLIELSHSPFKAVGSKKEYLIIDKGKEKQELKKKALVLEKTKAVLDTHSLIITKKFDLSNIASTAVMKEEELDSYKKIQELMAEVKKRENK